MRDIFAKNLIFYREKQGLGQPELAALLSKATGENFNSKRISSYESGDAPSIIKPQYLPALATILKVSIDDLFDYHIEKESVQIEEIVGVKRPDLKSLSRNELKETFNKYLDYLDSLTKIIARQSQEIDKKSGYIELLEEQIRMLQQSLDT